MDKDDVAITYTVKELLADIQRSVTVIDTKLDAKADKADVHALGERVNVLERFKERALGAAILLVASGAGGGYFLKELISG